MKKISKKQLKIIEITACAIIVIILGFIVSGFVKTIKNRNENASHVISMQEDLEIVEEINELTVQIDSKEEDRNDLEKNKETTEKKENKNDESKNNKNNGNQYYIKVNYGANVVTVYTKDDNGDYTIPIKAMVCSTGRGTPRSGSYGIKSRWEWGALFGGVYGHYVTKITGNILFHSVPYLRRGDPSSLEYWEYDKLGTAASRGCVRLMVKDSRWIYNSIPNGTIVEFYSSSDPGPLGKPSAPKISDNTECRGWDPTDTDANNPWNKKNDNSPDEVTIIPEPVVPIENKIIEKEPKNEIAVNNTINNEVNDVIENGDEEDSIDNTNNTVIEKNENIVTNTDVNKDGEINEIDVNIIKEELIEP